MTSAAKIPVIDISPTSDEAQAKVAHELVEAAIEHGFVYIKNRGADIPAEAVANAFDLVCLLSHAYSQTQEACEGHGVC